MPKQQLIEDQFDAETEALLKDVGVNIGASFRCTRFDDIFDTSWIDEWMEDHLIG